MDFEELLEKVKNPLRKQSLQGHVSEYGNYDQRFSEYKEYILHGDIPETSSFYKIKQDYLKLKTKFPERADKWLDTLANNYASKFVRTKTGGLEKIYEYQGIQVFIDSYTDPKFKDNVYNMRMLKNSINRLVNDTRDLMPNRKPKIIISDRYKNPKFSGALVKNPAAVYNDRLIYVDQHNIDDPDIFIHEFAHFVVDLIPKQTEPLLQKAYNDMLDIYWKRAKVKKRKLLPDDPSSKTQSDDANKWRLKISAKLGFPEYGLSNFDEFFAVLIENWKKLPNNVATYKYKTLVKGVLNRL